MVKIEINFGKKHLFILVLIGIFVSGSIVYAGLNPSIPNPGHPVSELQRCGANEVLKMDVTGTNWNCTTVSGGGLGTFVGATTQRYTGSMGGYSGANAKCAAEFSGSRMCTAADFANGRPTAEGRYSSFLLYSVGTDGYSDCLGWQAADSDKGGPYWAGGQPTQALCWTTTPILCCR